MEFGSRPKRRLVEKTGDTNAHVLPYRLVGLI